LDKKYRLLLKNSVYLAEKVYKQSCNPVWYCLWIW